MYISDDQKKYQEFKKMSRTLTHKNKIPTELQLKNIADDLKYYVEQIKLACKMKDEEKLDIFMEKTIKLFAKRSTLRMEQSKELYGELLDDIVEEEVKLYTTQCARFLNTVEALRSTYA